MLTSNVRARLVLGAAVVAVTGVGALVARPATAASPPPYTIVDLGVVGGGWTQALALNKSGQVAGQLYAPPGESWTKPFLYTGGALNPFGSLGGSDGGGMAIDATGDLAGYSTLTGGDPRAVFIDNDGIHNLGTLGGDSSIAWGMNDAGDVVGYSNRAGDSVARAFLYHDGVMEELPGVSDNSSIALDINNAGQIAGYMDAPTEEGYLYDHGQVTLLGSLVTGGWSAADAINDQGQVVGNSQYDDGQERAVLWGNGVMTNLGTLSGGDRSEAHGINNNGDVVGWSNADGSSQQTAVLYRGGQVYDLNQLIPSDSGWFLTGASGINDVNQIIGQGDLNGVNHAFLMTPVDTTPPVITATVSGDQGANGWYVGDVSVSWSVSDPESGIASSTDCDSTSVTNDTTGTTYTCAATDGAGMQSTKSVTIKRDTAPPTISCPSSDAAWHGSNVTLTCTATDGGSGLANPSDARFGLSTSVPPGTETTDASTAAHQVCDSVGNCSTGGPVSGNMIDLKPPSVNISSPSGPGTASNPQVLSAPSQSVGFSAVDGGSGIANWTLTRLSAALHGSGCPGSSNSDYTATGASGGSSLSDPETLAYGKCYEWTLVGTDAVGNVSTAFSSEVVRLPLLSTSSNSLTFGMIRHGTRKTLIEKFTNQSGKSLRVTSIKVTGAGFSQAFGSSCSTMRTLGAGASCTVGVSFFPSKAGTYGGDLNVIAGDTVTVSLTGTGK